MGSVGKPLVLLGCTPCYGHVMPIRAVAKDLVERGYEVTMVSSNHYKTHIEDIGASFVPVLGFGDWYEGDFDTRWPAKNTLAPGREQLAHDIEEVFVKSLTTQHEALQTALRDLTEKYPGRPIVQVNEGFFLGALAITQSAKGIQPTGTLGLGIIPMALSSIDLPAFGPGLPPDSSPEGREHNKATVKMVHQGWLAQAQKKFVELIEATGASTPKRHIFDLMYLGPDRFLQMCIPSAEYPRSDAPSSIRFAGGLPKGKRDASTTQPSWWNNIVNPNGKKIIAVCQGSIALNYDDLTIPTMEAFKTCDDIIVLVVLGKKGATLAADVPIPSNTRIADFIPFDELLPFCSVFITNGGYGAFQHAISNGTPIIVGGATEDKSEVAARVEWTGIGVNLKTGTPSTQALRDAVDQILKDPKYQLRGKELQEEMATWDPMSIVAKNIDELGAGLK